MNSVPGQPGAAGDVAYILVVEDELLVRMMVCDALREAGWHVIEAYNADEALVILSSGVPVDLVLSDVRMPGTMDGLGLLEFMRARYPELPVIIMSGHLAPEEALQKGARHFLAKPYSFDLALTLVEQELARGDNGG